MLAGVPRSILIIVAVLLAASGAAVGGMLALRGQADQPASGTFLPDDPQLGRRSYVFCQGCHGLDGLGVPRYAPALAASRWLTGDPQAAALIVLHGYDASGEAGSTYVSSRMLGHAAQMSDHEVAAALSWARSQWGNAAPPLPQTSVTTLRRRHAARTTPWTPAELRALAAEPR
jgi:mono/diheme cytochrome c family protein